MKILEIEIADIQPESARVLDIGCGQGWAVFDAAKQGAKAYGLDVSPELLRRARERAERIPLQKTPLFVLGSSDRVPFSSASFDLVLCTELIEHTLKTQATLSQICRLLKPNGIRILSFPTKYVEKIITATSKSFPAYSGHIVQFTLREMKSLLSQHQLEVLRVRRKYFEWSVYWLLRAMLKQIPSFDRRDERYGLESPADARWQRVDYYYKRFWAKALQWKLGIPVLWLGNQLFPKSYVLICRKSITA